MTVTVFTVKNVSSRKASQIWTPCCVNKMRLHEINHQNISLLAPGLHTLSEGNYDWIKLPVTQNQLYIL